MILISLNIRGVGGLLKLPTIRRLFSNNKPDIIFFQETLVSAEKARKFMCSIFPDWMTTVVSSVGTYGGLLVSWNPNIFDLQPFLSLGGILLTGIHLPDKRNLSFINSYGSCMACRHSILKKVSLSQ
jgi:hypothetical protein